MKEKKNACTGCAAAEADGRFVRHPESADGEAVVTAYPVFPGIEIAYCDIHAHECRLEHTPGISLMRISHCREGRLEQQMGNEYYFLAPGDLAVSRSDASDEAARFPTGHYHGITVTIDPAQAPECLSCLLSDVNVRPAALMEKFCADGGYFAARSSAAFSSAQVALSSSGVSWSAPPMPMVFMPRVRQNAAVSSKFSGE